MSGVFLSYRRDDVRHQAGRLADALEARFGASQVFRDVEAIKPGADFSQVIQASVGSCQVLLALIGPHWLDARDDRGQRRLDDPDDYVAFEIATALRSTDTVVVPVLVESAQLPPAARLPPALVPLTGRQALRLTDEMWDEQLARLVEVLEGAGVRRPRWAPRAAATAAVLVVAVLSLLLLDVPPFRQAAWDAVPTLPTPLEAAAVTGHDGRVWVAGGVSAAEGRPKLDGVQVYDAGTQSWRTGPPLPVALSHASLVSSGGSLYVLGGLSDTGSVATVYRLDSTTGQWQEDVPLPEPRGAGAAAWDGGRLVFGGGVGPDSRAADEVWALEEGQWRELGRLQQPREKLASVTDGFGTVWFATGRDPNSEVPALGLVDVVQARTVKPGGELEPRAGAAGVWWPGRGACVLGGQTPDGFTDEVECVQDSADQEPPTLSSARAGLGAAVVADALYVAGGYSTGSHGTAAVERLELGG